MKARDLRELGADELAQKLRETSRELAGLRIKNRSGSGAEKPVRMRALRRDVARMLTVARERESK
ncbi:MAG: 50S ribosomal protein L29 [Kiritimatiellae bacterium]|nr:50S ribosomal protein L29 [Kiritimatiellia bacterium]